MGDVPGAFWCAASASSCPQDVSCASFFPIVFVHLSIRTSGMESMEVATGTQQQTSRRHAGGNFTSQQGLDLLCSWNQHSFFMILTFLTRRMPRMWLRQAHRRSRPTLWTDMNRLCRFGKVAQRFAPCGTHAWWQAYRPPKARGENTNTARNLEYLGMVLKWDTVRHSETPEITWESWDNCM